MKLKQWLERLGRNEQATFVIAKAVKDEGSPMYYYEYRETPIRSVWEWLGGELKDYIVINADHPPIDIPGHWVNAYNGKRLKCCIVTTEEDIKTKYSPEQAKQMIAWYEKTVK